tara:strand:- start:234 stop:359 length:126 start_codon:yes stop_codon:yes gene_type:complete
MGLYWEHSGTKMGMRLKVYRREKGGNKEGMGMRRDLKNKVQ